MQKYHLRFAILAMMLWGVSWISREGAAWAHEGPPFPVLIDELVANQLVSVWADPDIGEARFFIVIETRDGNRPLKTPDVTLWTEPTSGRLDRASYAAEEQALRNSMQFFAEPYFDQRDIWNVGLRIKDSEGETAETVVQVESTPPGYGVWDLAIYLFPFVLIGGVWSYAMVRRIRQYRALQNGPSGEIVRGGQGHNDERHREHVLMEGSR
ncbi:hypothetical protein [Stieleria mannarensis]|uniref:hypothetical protein n=1 Tax=Stieleria mannarensis TaxID=2755585 RepID=UPI001601D779|nr:hypothetical protein [Rhodopirellula sp. JC639]